MTRPRAMMIAAAVVALLLVGCSAPSDDEAAGQDAPPTAPAKSVDPTAKASSPVSNGIPPAPDAKTEAAYIAALRKINADIVGDKNPEIIVDRGRNQCGAISNFPNDRAKLLEQTNTRFSAPGHPNGFGLQTAAKILDVVHQHLCPAYPMATA